MAVAWQLGNALTGIIGAVIMVSVVTLQLAHKKKPPLHM
jgi:hypothetical protein